MKKLMSIKSRVLVKYENVLPEYGLPFWIKYGNNTVLSLYWESHSLTNGIYIERDHNFFLCMISTIYYDFVFFEAINYWQRRNQCFVAAPLSPWPGTFYYWYFLSEYKFENLSQTAAEWLTQKCLLVTVWSVKYKGLKQSDGQQWN